MIALVRDHFAQLVDRASGFFRRRFQLLGRLDQRFFNRRGIAFVGRLQRDRHHRARLQIHRVLGLVRQVRTAVFHLRDLGVGIVGMLPILVAGLLLTFLVDLGQLLARRRLDSRFQS